MYCRNCGNEVSEKAIMCVACGTPPKAGDKFCYNCRAETTAGATICMKCGVSLKDTNRVQNRRKRLAHSSFVMFLSWSIWCSQILYRTYRFWSCPITDSRWLRNLGTDRFYNNYCRELQGCRRSFTCQKVKKFFNFLNREDL